MPFLSLLHSSLLQTVQANAEGKSSQTFSGNQNPKPPKRSPLATISSLPLLLLCQRLLLSGGFAVLTIGRLFLGFEIAQAGFRDFRQVTERDG